MVTCPSAINTTFPSLRTHKTVVPCICPLPFGFSILVVYRDASRRSFVAATAGKRPGQAGVLHWQNVPLATLKPRRSGRGGRSLLFLLSRQELSRFVSLRCCVRRLSEEPTEAHRTKVRFRRNPHLLIGRGGCQVSGISWNDSTL